MTKEIVVRMRQREGAIARAKVWRQMAKIRQDLADAQWARDFPTEGNIPFDAPRTPQQSRLERAAAYFRAVFR